MKLETIFRFPWVRPGRFVDQRRAGQPRWMGVPLPSRSALAVLPFLPWTLLVQLLLGCSSVSGPGSASFASVTITNRSPEEIRKMTEQVFRADGYEGYVPPAGEMVFEREGSRMSTFAYGGLMAAHEGAATWVRVRVNLVNLGEGTHRLQAQAYMVPYHGDSFAEEEKRISNFRSGPYQSLLDKVKKDLEPASP